MAARRDFYNKDKDRERRMRRKLVFLDIDGTILDENVKITDRTRYAIRQARKRGHVVCVATGRCMAEIRPEIREVGFDGYVSAAGAYIIYGDRVLYEEYLSESVLRQASEMIRKNRGVCVLEGSAHLYIPEEDWIRLEKQALTDAAAERLLNAYRGSERLFESFGEVSHVNKISYFWSGLSYEEVKEQAERLGLTATAFSMEWAAGESGELTKQGCHKGEGILRMAEYLGIEREDVLAIGDSANDIEMLQTAGVGIAMGNADECVKRLAREVTGSVLEDGVCQAFVKHGLSPVYPEDR